MPEKIFPVSWDQFHRDSFFDDKIGPNTNIVVRSRDADKLAQAKAAVEKMLEKVRASLKSG